MQNVQQGGSAQRFGNRPTARRLRKRYRTLPTRDVEGVASIQAEEPVPGKDAYRCNSGILRVPLEDTGFWSWARPSKALSLTVNGPQYWRRAVQIRPCSSCRRYLTSSALPNSAPPRPATPAHHTGYYPRGSHAPSSTPGSSHHALHYLNLLPSSLCCGAVRITTRRRATDLCTIIMAPVFVCARSRPNEMYQLNATAQYAESR